MTPDEADGFVGQDIGQVAVPADEPVVLVKPRLASIIDVAVVADRPVQVTEEFLVAVGPGLRRQRVAEVPFAVERRSVARSVESARQRRYRGIKAIICRADIGLEADTGRIAPGIECRPRRTTTCSASPNPKRCGSTAT